MFNKIIKSLFLVLTMIVTPVFGMISDLKGKKRELSSKMLSPSEYAKKSFKLKKEAKIVAEQEKIFEGHTKKYLKSLKNYFADITYEIKEHTIKNQTENLSIKHNISMEKTGEEIAFCQTIITNLRKILGKTRKIQKQTTKTIPDKQTLLQNIEDFYKAVYKKEKDLSILLFKIAIPYSCRCMNKYKETYLKLLKAECLISLPYDQTGLTKLFETNYFRTIISPNLLKQKKHCLRRQLCLLPTSYNLDFSLLIKLAEQNGLQPIDQQI